MDVGADNFRFDLDRQNGLAKACRTYRKPKTYTLHVDSRDRYRPNMFRTTDVFTNFNSQTVSKTAGPFMLDSRENPGTVVKISNQRNLINGYFSRIALTEISINLATQQILVGFNGRFYFTTNNAGVETARTAAIDAGWYTPVTLAAAIQVAVRAAAAELPSFTCNAPYTVANSPLQFGFVFATNTAVTMRMDLNQPGVGQGSAEASARFLRLIGFTNRTPFGYSEFNEGQQTLTAGAFAATLSGGAPQYAYTPYIDIFSSYLSNYKAPKDANTALGSRYAHLARVYMAECPLQGGGFNTSVPVIAPDRMIVGTSPTIVYKSFMKPNWCEWSPNQSIDQIDITLREAGGNLLNWSPTSRTEFDATFTLSE
jgi:hypothetical protein